MLMRSSILGVTARTTQLSAYETHPPSATRSYYGYNVASTSSHMDFREPYQRQLKNCRDFVVPAQNSVNGTASLSTQMSRQSSGRSSHDYGFQSFSKPVTHTVSQLPEIVWW